MKFGLKKLLNKLVSLIYFLNFDLIKIKDYMMQI